MPQDGLQGEVAAIQKLYDGERLGFQEVAARLGISPWRVYRLMRRHGIARRRGSEQNYAAYRHKPQFTLKLSLTREEETLKVAGSMLYWAEGAKTGKVVCLANSDPKLVRVFMAFLRTICGVGEARLRVLLYAYEDQDLGALKRFWSEVTGVPQAQFIKPYVRALTPNVSGRRMPYGLVQVRYADKRLLALLRQWTDEFARVWAGT